MSFTTPPSAAPITNACFENGTVAGQPVTAKRKGATTARRAAGERCEEKSVHLEGRTITGSDGRTHALRLYARGGALGIGEPTDTGELTFTDLRRVRTHRNSDKSGRFRWYNDYQLPERYGPGTLTGRLHGNDTDRARKLNRAENLRPIPPSDADFARLYPRRNDAGSINRDLDDTLYLRRAHTVGHARQHLNLLGYALVVNAVALHRHRRNRAPTGSPPSQLPEAHLDLPASARPNTRPGGVHRHRAPPAAAEQTRPTTTLNSRNRDEAVSRHLFSIARPRSSGDRAVDS